MKAVLNLIGSKFIYPCVAADSMSISSCYKDTGYLETLDPDEYVRNKEPLLITFLNGVTRHNVNTTIKQQTMYVYAMMIEFIYHLRNQNLALPFSFLSNVIQTLISGSKTVTSINGKLLSGGSDTTYRVWLNVNVVNPLPTPPRYLNIFSDNVGKYIVKGYRVQHEHAGTPNVVTATLNIPQNNETKSLQNC